MLCQCAICHQPVWCLDTSPHLSQSLFSNAGHLRPNNCHEIILQLAQLADKCRIGKYPQIHTHSWHRFYIYTYILHRYTDIIYNRYIIVHTHAINMSSPGSYSKATATVVRQRASAKNRNCTGQTAQSSWALFPSFFGTFGITWNFLLDNQGRQSSHHLFASESAMCNICGAMMFWLSIAVAFNHIKESLGWFFSAAVFAGHPDSMLGTNIRLSSCFHIVSPCFHRKSLMIITENIWNPQVIQIFQIKPASHTTHSLPRYFNWVWHSPLLTSPPFLGTLLSPQTPLTIDYQNSMENIRKHLEMKR